MAKVSIITPTYNRDWILPRAIDCVLQQTISDWELLVVDDASTDSTAEVMARYADERIHLINLAQNKGLSGARNVGLTKASSELIAYLDSDNVWFPNYLEVMIPAIKDQVFMAYSGQNTLLVDGNKGNYKVIGRQVRNKPYNPNRLMTGNYIDINCVVHKRALIDEVGNFDESLNSLEDWDLFVRIAVKYPFGIKHIDQVLSEYYFFTQQTTTTLSNERWGEWILKDFNQLEPMGDKAKVISRISQLLNQ